MKHNGTKRVLITGDDGRDNRAIAMAMKLGIELSRKVAKDIEGLTLLVQTKKSIRHESLESVVSPRIAKMLHKGLHIPMGRGLDLRAVTAKSYINGTHRDIVIAIGADAKMMAKVDNMAGLHTVIAVPEKDGALDDWARTWSPLVPGSEKKAEEPVLNKEHVMIEPVIADALSALAGSVDLSRRSLEKQDRRQVENMVKLLRQNNYREKPDKIRKWAVNNGWQQETADELVGIWEEVYFLKNKAKIKEVSRAKKKDESWAGKQAAA